jgi:formimidoylglutamate deiminase
LHATHLSASETARLAASSAVAGLCPTTEANLGDGLFPLAPYIAAGGVFGIGSDSHVSQSPVEELRWLE